MAFRFDGYDWDCHCSYRFQNCSHPTSLGLLKSITDKKYLSQFVYKTYGSKVKLKHVQFVSVTPTPTRMTAETHFKCRDSYDNDEGYPVMRLPQNKRLLVVCKRIHEKEAGPECIGTYTIVHVIGRRKKEKCQQVILHEKSMRN